MTQEEICRSCRMLPSIHHLEYPSCKQPIGPINEEERRKLGTNTGNRVTGEWIMKAAEIAIQPYCLKRMIAGGYFDGIEKISCKQEGKT